MPGKPDKPHRIRVRTLDGKPRDTKELNKLKSNQLGMPHLDIASSNVANELIVCASKEAHIEQVRAKLGGAGLEEVPGGETAIAASAAPMPTNTQQTRQGGFQQRGGPQHLGDGSLRMRGGHAPAATNAQPLPGKPYGFVALPKELTSAPPVWHDGTSSAGRHSGEIRFELETLTPLLVGWERGQVGEAGSDWPLPESLDAVGPLVAKKSVLCPLRAPWDKRPVVIPGDSLKGLLRHELGALLGAPMERVAERSYSYRPNALFAKDPNPRLIARLARVPSGGVGTKALDNANQVRVPNKLELLPTSLRYDKKRGQSSNYYRFDDGNGAPYRGGQGAGEKLNSKRNLHRMLTANPSVPTENVEVPQVVQEGYLATLRHLIDLDHGHFSERHPDVPNTVKADAARKRILKAATSEVFQPGDLIWVEWDTEKKSIVSLGWHYYYRWAYTDSVRKDADAPKLERHGLFPLDAERTQDNDGAPSGLSSVRRLFGYTGDNEGGAGIGTGDHAQLMGRVSVNAGLEVIEDGDTDEKRFLPPTFLKELGMPRPSAVEHYLKQPHHPSSRPSDKATLVTYGDAAGYDAPGELAGRKFYLDRKDAYTGEPWKDDSPANRANDRSTLALEASRPGRRFRFTLRFRDLDAAELAAILVALCPHQFRAVLSGPHADGYCSKLGYARPLGWGSVRIDAKALLLLEVDDGKAVLKRESDVLAWVTTSHQRTATQTEWLDVHRHKHPDAADYPRAKDRDGNENIYTFHTTLRAEHSRARRYRNEGGPMTTLLVLTAGQSDVQLIVDGVRRELDRDGCAALHDELERRGFALGDAPVQKGTSIGTLPEGELSLCTPKLDAVLREVLPAAALVLETRRDASAAPGDPHFAGMVLEARLKAKGVGTIRRLKYLHGAERLEDRDEPRDAVIRREIVQRLEHAVRNTIEAVKPSRVVIAATGGFPIVTNLVEEIVRLYASVPVEALEVADGTKASPPTADRAVARTSVPEPIASFQARRRALDLIAKGNLLGAWAVAEPLHTDEVERRWTQVVEWLARFASSLPIPEGCDIPVLSHQRMAVRAALRVELALRAGDIPRAVHGTVAFFEAALWDHLGERIERSEDPKKRRFFKIKDGAAPSGEKLVRKSDGSDEDRKRPFELKETIDGVDWYWVHDGDGGPAARLANRFLQCDALTAFDKALGSDIRQLRNDVAHNEPTPALMDDARRRMQDRELWSSSDTFLSQPLVQAVLCELGEAHPELRCEDLITTVRSRLVAAEQQHAADGATRRR